MIKPLEDSQFEESHKTKQRGEGKRLSPLKTSGEKNKLKTTTCKSVTTGCPTKPPCTINSIIYICVCVYNIDYTILTGDPLTLVGENWIPVMNYWNVFQYMSYFIIMTCIHTLYDMPNSGQAFPGHFLGISWPPSQKLSPMPD